MTTMKRTPIPTLSFLICLSLPPSMSYHYQPPQGTSTEIYQTPFCWMKTDQTSSKLHLEYPGGISSIRTWPSALLWWNTKGEQTLGELKGGSGQISVRVCQDFVIPKFSRTDGKNNPKGWRLGAWQRARELHGAMVLDDTLNCHTEPMTQLCRPDILTYH